VFSRFGNYAQWIRRNELGTLSYELAQSDSDNLELLITERYVNKEAYKDIHKTTTRFLEFKNEIVKMNDDGSKEDSGWELSGQSYNELNVGFV
jgi:quinol monooxygenase YgiN